MNDRITAGAAALTASILIGTRMVHLAVWPPSERSKQQETRATAVLTDDSLADDLLGPWEPEQPDGIVMARDWRDCLRCGQATRGVVYGDGSFECGQCTNHPQGVAS